MPAPEEAAAPQDQHFWFREAFEQSPEGLAIATPSGQWIQVNPTLCCWLGYERDKLLQICARGHAATLATPFWRYTFKDLIPAEGQESCFIARRDFYAPGSSLASPSLDITVTRIVSPTGETLALLGRFANNGKLYYRQKHLEEVAHVRLQAMQHAAASISRGRLLLCEKAQQLPEPLPPMDASSSGLSLNLEKEEDKARLRDVLGAATVASGLPSRCMKRLLIAAEAAHNVFEYTDSMFRMGVSKTGWLQVWVESAAWRPVLMFDGPNHAWRGLDWMHEDRFSPGGWRVDPPADFLQMVRGADRVWFYPGHFADYPDEEEQQNAVIVLEAFSLRSRLLPTWLGLLLAFIKDCIQSQKETRAANDVS